MHVSDETQILLVATGFAYRHAPFLDSLENLGLHSGCSQRRSLRKPADKLVEEFLGADLQVERVTAILDAYIEEAEGQERNIRISVVDVADDHGSRLARGRSLLAVD